MESVFFCYDCQSVLDIKESDNKESCTCANCGTENAEDTWIVGKFEKLDADMMRG